MEQYDSIKKLIRKMRESKKQAWDKKYPLKVCTLITSNYGFQHMVNSIS